MGLETDRLGGGCEEGGRGGGASRGRWVWPSGEPGGEEGDSGKTVSSVGTCKHEDTAHSDLQGGIQESTSQERAASWSRQRGPPLQSPPGVKKVRGI